MLSEPETECWTVAVTCGYAAGVRRAKGLCGRCGAAVACALVLASGSPAATCLQEAQFLAGCEVLAVATNVAPERRAEAFRWLVRHTGITASKAREIIESCRNRPDEWRRMLESVRGCLEDAGMAEPGAATPVKQRGEGNGTR